MLTSVAAIVQLSSSEVAAPHHTSSEFMMSSGPPFPPLLFPQLTSAQLIPIRILHLASQEQTYFILGPSGGRSEKSM